MPEINVPLLEQTLAQIEAHPETWQQTHWRCETGMCFAGWTAALAGGRWLEADPKATLSAWLEVEDDDDPEAVVVLDDRRGIDVEERARRLLGLDEGEGGLFSATNDIDDIRRIVAALKAAAEQSPLQEPAHV